MVRDAHRLVRAATNLTTIQTFIQLTANQNNCMKTNNYTLFQPENNQTMDNNNNNDRNSDGFPRDED